MPKYIQNYGFTKTFIHDNNNNINNEIQWISDYDGKIANIDININKNGYNDFVSMKLDNNNLRNIFNIQSVEKRIDERLINDFLININMSKSPKPIVLNNLIQPKSRKHNKKIKKNKSKRHKIKK